MSTWTLEVLLVRVRDEDGQVYTLDMTQDVERGRDYWGVWGDDIVSVDTVVIAEALELEREGVREEK